MWHYLTYIKRNNPMHALMIRCTGNGVIMKEYLTPKTEAIVKNPDEYQMLDEIVSVNPQTYQTTRSKI